MCIRDRLKAFRTSFDWSRIYPNGDDEEPDQEGLEYYDRLIASIKKHGMEPFMTCLLYTSPDSSQLDGGGRPLPVYLYGSVCGECGCDIG